MWLDRSNYDLESLHRQSLKMVGAITQNREAILDVLGGIATRSSVIDEIHRAVRTLAGAPFEVLRNDPRQLDRLCLFFPSNNLLYSYALFALVPSLYTDHILIRASTRVRQETAELHRLLGPHAAGSVSLLDVSQREFVEESRSSDAVVFTGQPDNAAAVRQSLAEGPRVLCFGSGPTPLVIGPDANARRAVRELVNARLFNSGQDCLGPDITFVHADLLPEVQLELTDLLQELRAEDADRDWPHLMPSGYTDAVLDAHDFVQSHRNGVVYGGDVDIEVGAVAPTVIVMDWDLEYEPAEFFSPVFCIMTYDRADQLQQWLRRPRQQLHGMYASVFGEPGLPEGICGTTRVVHGMTAFDIEDGNVPFGGCGPNAGSVQVGHRLFARPLLLSAEMSTAERVGAPT